MNGRASSLSKKQTKKGHPLVAKMYTVGKIKALCHARGHVLVQEVHGQVRHGLFALERVQEGLLKKCKLRNESVA